MINEHATEFAGKPVVDWEPDESHAAPHDAIFRVSLAYDEAEEGQHWTDKFAAFLDDPRAAASTGLVIGTWDSSQASEDTSAQVIEALVAARDRLPNLTALFLGDIISEESEISWIQQSDISPIFDAFPRLTDLCVRGGSGLQLGAVRHDALQSLVLQSGGLGAAVVRAVVTADLPQLEHLELWLGSENYGGDATVDDVAPLLAGTVFPRLRYLGLRDSEQADALAAALAHAPIVERIETLDLSLGTLTDEGAMALRLSPAVARLKKLDIHHHFCSEAVVMRLQGLGIEVDVSDPHEAEEYNGEVWRYAAVTE